MITSTAANVTAIARHSPGASAGHENPQSPWRKSCQTVKITKTAAGIRTALRGTYASMSQT